MIGMTSKDVGEWVLVPREPTPEMLKAGMDDLGWWVEPYEAPRECGVPVDSDMSAEDAAKINAMQMEVVESAFRAMLSAAPLPQGGVEPGDLVELLRAPKKQISYGVNAVEIERAASDLEIEAASALSTLLAERDALAKDLAQRDALLIRAEKLRFGNLTVESRGASQWAVCDTGVVLNASGSFEYEPSPSNRSDEFIARTRFTFSDAVSRARALSLTEGKGK